MFLSNKVMPTKAHASCLRQTKQIDVEREEEKKKAEE